MPDQAIEDLRRDLRQQVLGAVVQRYGHLDAAEDAAQEALIAAATQWPTEGIPANPRALGRSPLWRQTKGWTRCQHPVPAHGQGATRSA
jgi:DNA-directed RNA polymerase specialized sigma24 family protein